MITSALGLVGSLLYFVLPFLLTLKTISDLGDARASQRAIFLLHYWLCYWFVGQIQTVLSIATLAGLPFSSDLVTLAFAVVKVWLFYHHGCLVVPRVVLQPFLCRFFRTNSFRQFEAGYVEPVARLLPSGALFASDLGPLTRYAQFYSAYQRSATSFLSFCVDHVCYIDSDKALYQRYYDLSLSIMFWLGHFRALGATAAHHRHDLAAQNFSPKTFQLLPPQEHAALFVQPSKSIPRLASKTYNLDLDFFTRRRDNNQSFDTDADHDDTFESFNDSMEFVSKKYRDLSGASRRVESIPNLSDLADELPLMGSRLRSHLTSRAERPTVDRTNAPTGIRSVLSPQDLPYPIVSPLPKNPAPETFVPPHKPLPQTQAEYVNVKKLRRKSPPRL